MTVLASAACDRASADDKAATPVQEDGTKSVVQCGMNALDEAFAHTPNALKKASQVYQEIDSTGNAVAALESVYAKKLSDFTYEEQSESFFILSGLAHCDEGNATAKESASNAIALLLSGQPASNLDTQASATPTIGSGTISAIKQNSTTQTNSSKQTSTRGQTSSSRQTGDTSGTGGTSGSGGTGGQTSSDARDIGLQAGRH